MKLSKKVVKSLAICALFVPIFFLTACHKTQTAEEIKDDVKLNKNYHSIGITLNFTKNNFDIGTLKYKYRDNPAAFYMAQSGITKPKNTQIWLSDSDTAYGILDKHPVKMPAETFGVGKGKMNSKNLLTNIDHFIPTNDGIDWKVTNNQDSLVLTYEAKNPPKKVAQQFDLIDSFGEAFYLNATSQRYTKIDVKVTVKKHSYLIESCESKINFSMDKAVYQEQAKIIFNNVKGLMAPEYVKKRAVNVNKYIK